MVSDKTFDIEDTDLCSGAGLGKPALGLSVSVRILKLGNFFGIKEKNKFIGE